MEYLGVETSQNVILEQELASVWQRILAFLLDFAFIFVYFLIIILIVGIFKGGGVLFFILGLPIYFYSLILENFFNGQSFGKMILRIKVVKTDGSEPSFFNYFLRWIFRLLDVIFSYGALGIVTILMNGRGQRLGDILAETSVIRISQGVFLEQTLLRQLPNNYQVVFQNVSRLSEIEINLVHETLQYMNAYESDNSQNLALQLKAGLEKKINGGVVVRMDCYTFLQTLIYDYNFINKTNI